MFRTVRYRIGQYLLHRHLGIEIKKTLDIGTDPELESQLFQPKYLSTGFDPNNKYKEIFNNNKNEYFLLENRYPVLQTNNANKSQKKKKIKIAYSWKIIK